MKIKVVIVFLIILSLNVFELIACSCRWFDTFQAKEELYNRKDIVVVGKPIKIVNRFRTEDSSNVFGYDVLIKIFRAYKGEFKSDTLLIIQAENNCSIGLTINDSLLIFADLVSSVREYNSEIENNSRDSSGYYRGNRSFYIDKSRGYFKLIKSAQQKYLTGSANQCVMFEISDTTHVSDKNWVQFIRTKRSQ